MATTKPVPVDSVQIEANFSRGMTRDSARSMIAEGSVYDAVDFMLEQPGRAYKRGGWVLHSAALPAAPSMVATIHIPTRVVAIANDSLYDVTSETSAQADLVGSVGFTTRENPCIYVGRIILCDSTVANQPKKVTTTGPTGAVTLSALGGAPPWAAHSTVNASRIVLGRGALSAGFSYSDAPYKNRLWFSELPDVEATWDTANKYFDTTYEITGLASIQGVLLVFSPHFTERLIGGVPPGEEGENMELQPVGGVGCLDARSIVTLDNQIIFASEEGVFTTNGVGFANLMENPEGTGILSLWRGLFADHEVRSISSGMLNRDYLFVSTHSTDGSNYDFVCYLPTRSWWRTTNTSTVMFASGATEQETTELYAAMRDTPYVARFGPLLKPTWGTRADGNGAAVSPSLHTRMFGTGPGLKAFGFGRLTWDMDIPDSVRNARRAPSTAYTVGAMVFEQNRIFAVTTAGTSNVGVVNWLAAAQVGQTLVDGTVTWTNMGPQLEVAQAVGIEADSFSPVFESPLHATQQTADRTRFRLFKDTQALYLRLTQSGGSDQTELFLVEVEHRPYGLPADGE